MLYNPRATLLILPPHIRKVINVGPYPSWANPHTIVSIDPFGADVARLYGKQIAQGLDIRPTIAMTRAHMRVAEIEEIVQKGKLGVGK